MTRTVIHRLARLACTALAVMTLALAGCESEPKRTAEGPPPAGFDTWEEYWEVQDELDRERATQIEQRRRERDVVGGAPRN